MRYFPLKKKAYITEDSMSFKNRNFETDTEIPIGEHLGAYAVERRHHVHEGIDLYAPVGEKVYAVEDGEIIKIDYFTGKEANSDWWLTTKAICVEGESGVIVYGEIIERDGLKEGDKVKAGEYIGNVLRVLVHDKGRPTSMLHFELRSHGAKEDITWYPDGVKPEHLKDPTNLLIEVMDNIP